MTIGEAYGPAMTMTDQAEADAYFEKLVQMGIAEGNLTRERSEEIQRANLGYYAGYYDNETRERVERLFRCQHPVFGSIAKVGAPTAKQAFEMGKQMGEKLKTTVDPKSRIVGLGQG